MRKRTSGKKASKRYGKRKPGYRRAGTSTRSSRSYRKKVSTTFVGPRGPVKDKTVLKLRYSDTYSVLSGVGNLSLYTYRGNSCFDPDFTGIGSQPYGWDQWTPLYQRYRVIGSQMRVKAMSYASDSTAATATEGCAQVYLVPNLSSSGLAPLFAGNLFDIANMPYAKQLLVVPNKQCVTKAYMPTGKLWGYTKNQIKSMSEFESSTASNPSREWFWQLYVGGIDLQAVNVYVNVEITYYVEMYQRVNQAPS